MDGSSTGFGALWERRCWVVGGVVGGAGLASCAWAQTAAVTAKIPKVAHPRKCNILTTPFSERSQTDFTIPHGTPDDLVLAL
jgi:hypothetical protein